MWTVRRAEGAHPPCVLLFEDASLPERRQLASLDEDAPIQAPQYRHSVATLDGPGFEVFATQTLFVQSQKNGWSPRAAAVLLEGFEARLGDFVLRVTTPAKAAQVFLIYELSFPPACRLPPNSMLLRDRLVSLLPVDSKPSFASPNWLSYGLLDPLASDSSDESADWSIAHSAVALIDILRSQRLL